MKKKKETYENLFTLLRNFLLEIQSKILLYTKNHYLVKKYIVLLDWLTSVLSIIQKPKVANNSITILGYSNHEDIYIAKNIISID